MAEDEKAVVIDNGSGFIKAGFGGDAGPTSIFPTYVGRPKHLGRGMNTSYVGDEAQNFLGNMTLEHPIKHGIIEDWYNMEKIWEYTFEEKLKYESKNSSILLTEMPLNPKQNREKTAEIMFEKFEASKFFLVNQSVSGIMANGINTGILLNSGESSTNVLPILNGYSIPHAFINLKFGGKDLTSFLVEMLNNRDYSLTTAKEINDVNNFKGKCYVCKDFFAEMAAVKTTPSDFKETCKLYNNGKVDLLHERFRCPEALFDPTLLGKDWPGIHQIIKKSIDKCDPQLISELYGNIVLAGGSTLFPGLPKRLQKEVETLVPSGTMVKIIAPTDRSYSSWVGGSIFATLSALSWMTKEDYDESGSQIVHEKCHF